MTLVDIGLIDIVVGATKGILNIVINDGILIAVLLSIPLS